MTEYAKLRQQRLNDMRSHYGVEMISATEAAKEYGKKKPYRAKDILDNLPSVLIGKRRYYPIGDIASDIARRMLSERQPHNQRMGE